MTPKAHIQCTNYNRFYNTIECFEEFKQIQVTQLCYRVSKKILLHTSSTMTLQSTYTNYNRVYNNIGKWYITNE